MTTVECYAYSLDYQFLTDYALVTNGSASMQPGSLVIGDVRYIYDGPLPDPNIKGDIEGDVTLNEPIRNWPTAENVTAFYLDDVAGLVPESSYHINRRVDNIGPLYLYNSGEPVRITSAADKCGQLDGTVYVSGDLKVDLMQGSQIDLNGQTIFVDGSIGMQPGTPFSGPGCIIATGDINFQPNLMNTEFVLVMSVEGSIRAQPGSDFYGTLAAANGVQIQPGGGIINPGTDPGDLHFPGMDEETHQITIAAYTVK